MTIRLAIFGIAVLLLGSSVAAAQDRCVAARDLLAGARDRLQPGATRAVMLEASDALRRATDLCPGLGDAYYFLSLLGRELKDDARAENWRLKAEFYGSAAMKGGEPLLATHSPTSEPTVAVATATLSSPTTSAIRVPPFVRQRLALVVGVSKFRDPKINALRYTTADASAISEMLTLAGFDQVKTLLDEQATTYNIKTEINQIAKMAGPEDLVVLYFASHGSPENLDTAGVNYIVTYDTEVNNLYPTAFRMDDLTEDIGGRIKAERVVALLDTCYSGGTFRELPQGWTASSRSLSGEQGLPAATLQGRLQTGARSVVVDTDMAGAGSRMPQGVGRVIITASSQSERSWENEGIKHGYFTYFLLEALKKPGPVSTEDIFAELRVKVPEAVRRERGESQHPTIARSRDRVELYLREGTPATKPVR